MLVRPLMTHYKMAVQFLHVGPSLAYRSSCPLIVSEVDLWTGVCPLFALHLLPISKIKQTSLSTTWPPYWLFEYWSSRILLLLTVRREAYNSLVAVPEVKKSKRIEETWTFYFPCFFLPLAGTSNH